MQRIPLTVPDIILMAGTRVALGIGVGLLISGKLTADARRAAGRALIAVGGLTTIPLALSFAGRRASGGSAV